MSRIAWTLIITGSLVLSGYGAYHSFDSFFKESTVSIPVKVAAPVVLAGVIILLLVVLKDRITARRREDFRKDEA